MANNKDVTVHWYPKEEGLGQVSIIDWFLPFVGLFKYLRFGKQAVAGMKGAMAGASAAISAASARQFALQAPQGIGRVFVVRNDLRNSAVEVLADVVIDGAFAYLDGSAVQRAEQGMRDFMSDSFGATEGKTLRMKMSSGLELHGVRSTSGGHSILALGKGAAPSMVETWIKLGRTLMR